MQSLEFCRESQAKLTFSADVNYLHVSLVLSSRYTHMPNLINILITAQITTSLIISSGLPFYVMSHMSDHVLCTSAVAVAAIIRSRTFRVVGRRRYFSH